MGQFQPTPRMYGATAAAVRAGRPQGNFNPRPVCTGRHYGSDRVWEQEFISTHAPYVRGDPELVNMLSCLLIFQPTPRMYGATGCGERGKRACRDFNPRPVCTGRLEAFADLIESTNISTHAPYVRGDSGRAH